MKTHYELLAVERTADGEEVKRAFRREIARYHPDKVQHLGPEFQQIAATRASELTEAYRILMDPSARQQYDASLDGARPAVSADTDRAHPATAAPAVQTPDHAGPDSTTAPLSESMRQTQATLSQFVRKATIGRLEEAVAAVFDRAEPLRIQGFDVAVTVKPKKAMFQKPDPPVQLLARVVSVVDRQAIEETWPVALKIGGPDRIVCLMLLGIGLAPSRELAATIADHRRRTRQTAPIVLPVDARNWDALVPPETPPGVRKLLDRLKLGS